MIYPGVEENPNVCCILGNLSFPFSLCTPTVIVSGGAILKLEWTGRVVGGVQRQSHLPTPLWRLGRGGGNRRWRTVAFRILHVSCQLHRSPEASWSPP